MKAAIYKKYGPPEVVQVMDVPKPEPKHDEVRIKVHASTVNRTDCGFRSANYFIVRFFSGLFRPKRPTLGCEFSGVIDSVGTAVTNFQPGDKVFGFDDHLFGGHAEYMILPSTAAIVKMPSGISFEEAACISEGAHYALFYIRAAHIGPGTTMVINGATGAIGSAGVQLCVHMGAHVTAVCETKHVDLVKSLGADAIIDYTQQDFTQLDQLFDVVFDSVGKSNFGKCKRILKKKGIYMSSELGPRYENPFLAIYTPWFGGKKVLFPMPSTKIDDIKFLKELVESGKYKPVIDRMYPLEKIVDAYHYVETGMKTGNVVIQVAPVN